MLDIQRVERGGIRSGIRVELREIPPIIPPQFHHTQSIDYQDDNYLEVEGRNFKRQKLFFLGEGGKSINNR